jgi:choline dehydrogenase-like flavoprotein
MSIYTLADAQTDQSHRTAPICIIGAGLAGLLVAVRLARAGRRVIVVESGNASFETPIHELNAIDDPAQSYRPALTGRFREFGGNSRYWGGRLIPLSLHDTDARPHLSLPGWPIPLAELARYQRDIETIFALDNTSYEEDLIEQMDPDGFLQRGDADVTCRWGKIPSFRRTNLAATLKDELARRNNVEVWLGATVCDFELDRISGLLKGVVARNFSGRQLTVRAQEFVWAAGAIESTRLLLLLDTISEHNAFRSCDALGRYFQEHAKVAVGHVSIIDRVKTNKLFGYRFAGLGRRSLYLELSPTVQKADEVASAYAEVALDLLPNSPLSIARGMLRSIQKRQLAVSLTDARHLASCISYLMQGAYWYLARRQMLMAPDTGLKLDITVEQVPDRSNQITLSHRRDRLDVPMVRLDWRLTDRDERTFQSAMKRVADYWKRSGFDQICPIDWMPHIRDPSTRLIDMADSRAHPSGTTRMGTDPCHSVVSPDLHCHHVPNISVVSTSTFPSAGSINPTMTLMQLALRKADALLQSPKLIS